ncbi:hypothetical protein VULLAG_LOCUS18909 [Vulpes lagopus]
MFFLFSKLQMLVKSTHDEPPISAQSTQSSDQNQPSSNLPGTLRVYNEQYKSSNPADGNMQRLPLANGSLKKPRRGVIQNGEDKPLGGYGCCF